MMEAVQLKGPRRPMAQSVDGREPVTGYPRSIPYLSPASTVCVADNEDPVFNIDHHSPCKGVMFERNTGFDKYSAASNSSFVSMVSEDDSAMVVDMGSGAGSQQVQPVKNLVTTVREAGLSDHDCNIKFRKRHQILKDSTDLQVLQQPCEVTEKKGGYIVNGDDKDICQLLNKEPAPACQGVICNNRVLCIENGDYSEDKQYKAYPDTKSKGAYGEAAMCQDLTSRRTFLCKKVYGPLFKNEVMVPLMFRGNAGIPEIYGVTRKDQTTEIFQEFAGLSLEKLCTSAYAARLRDPGILLGLAFQGFTTLDRLHSKGVQHLDIKPQNVCVDFGQKVPHLKLIDFGSSQMPGETVTEGLTFEYLSPESCCTVLRVGTKQQTEGRLESGADVWAMALSLLYCLCGYHLMVYACTGDVVYREIEPEKKLEQRIQCLFKIYKMTDADIITKLICPEWPEVLKELFINTLRVNPEHRWSAGQAAAFILDYLSVPNSVTDMAASPRWHCCPPIESAAQKSAEAESVAGPSRLRIRVQITQNEREGQPVPCNLVVPSRLQLQNSGQPVSYSLSKTEAQPCKRKYQVEPTTHGYKVQKR